MKKLKWTIEEDNELIRQRVDLKLPYKSIVIKNRTSAAITARLSVLVQEGKIIKLQPNFNRWTAEEDEFLKQLVDRGESNYYIAEVLNRSIESIKTRRKRFTHTITGRLWTLEDVSKLSSNKSYRELAVELNKTERSVGAKLQKLRILQEPYSANYSHEDLLDIVRKYKCKDILNYCRLDNEPSAGVIERVFGNWSLALEAAGISPNLGMFDQNKCTILYLVDFGKFKKIGITQRSVYLRFLGFPCYDILDSITFNSPIDAFETEQEILSKVNKVLGDLPNGNTECFISNCTQLSDLI